MTEKHLERPSLRLGETYIGLALRSLSRDSNWGQRLAYEQKEEDEDDSS